VGDPEEPESCVYQIFLDGQFLSFVLSRVDFVFRCFGAVPARSLVAQGAAAAQDAGQAIASPCLRRREPEAGGGIAGGGRESDWRPSFARIATRWAKRSRKPERPPDEWHDAVQTDDGSRWHALPQDKFDTLVEYLAKNFGPPGCRALRRETSPRRRSVA